MVGGGELVGFLVFDFWIVDASNARTASFDVCGCLFSVVSFDCFVCFFSWFVPHVDHWRA